MSVFSSDNCTAELESVPKKKHVKGTGHAMAYGF